MLKIGLTGGIGSGKSTATKIFSNLGITVIDADQIAHKLTQSGTESFNKIKELFGNEFITHNGELDRRKIAKYIFSNPSKKLALENILHPVIKHNMLQKIEELSHKNYIILEIPLLIETGFVDIVDRILVIETDTKIKIKRIQQRDDRTEAQIRSIMSHQINHEQRLEQADDILDNNGSLDDLRNSIERLHQRYLDMNT